MSSKNNLPFAPYIQTVPEAKALWELPEAKYFVYREKKQSTCIVIPVLNEGDRIATQLAKMLEMKLHADIVICDGGSTDGCTDESIMRKFDVRAVIKKLGPGKMSAQLRLAMAYATEEGYENIINMDGNNKDGYEAIPKYIDLLSKGVDVVLGSRYIKGGLSEHTPLSRTLAIKLIHSPIISLGAHRFFTDTTNSFRGYKRHIFLDKRIRPFRNIFDVYNLPYYLAVRSSRLGYNIVETPVRRSYPADGTVPTKITGIKSKINIIKEILKTSLGMYNP